MDEKDRGEENYQKGYGGGRHHDEGNSTNGQDVRTLTSSVLITSSSSILSLHLIAFYEFHHHFVSTI